ncbi:hypothetical protein C8Q73DRAFT_751369 [Cubamyces lactineus]|nr:hypothetical protein C8Q73DRAFT_751369 [Cubamyces lactineus]
MAGVIASSPSPVMSSNVLPRTPPRASQHERGVANAGGGSGIAQSFVIGAGPDAMSTDIEANFFSVHLRPCPEKPYLRLQQNAEVVTYTREIMDAPEEYAMYRPMAQLLTLLSKKIFDSIPSRDKRRLHLQPERPVIFLDHHSCSLTRFPVGDPKEFPDIVGVLKPADMGTLAVHTDGSYREIPFHCVETVVEAKVKGKQTEGRRQVSSYIHHLLQARPDRPAYYGMNGIQDSFQLFYGSPLGLRASALVPWTDLKTLCAYVYSLYDPPDGHILYDRTIEWSEPPHVPNPLGSPMWRLTVNGETYDGARIVFLGYPYGRRTTVFRIDRVARSPIIIKEYYLENGRRYNEAELLAQIHADGYVPGVVRVVASETVESDGEAVIFTEANSTETRTKQRLVFGDFGVDLEYAESVNDLLMAVYDVLEVHRTVASKRKVLHRDMSLFNILMYPQRPPCEDALWMQNMPPLITEVLSGVISQSIPPTPLGLLIDYDHACKLEDAEGPSENHEAIRRELKFRTGTPMYIARAVTVAAFPCSAACLVYQRMPELFGKAKELYISAYGQERYDRYTDPPKGFIFHGGVPRPECSEDIEEIAQSLPFYHRWEYDAESIFWTMYSVLLRVRPLDGQEADGSDTSLEAAWGLLKAHTIPEGKKTKAYADQRDLILQYKKQDFRAAFMPIMEDVANLLLDIKRQVTSTWAVMDPPPPFDDHLHEAIQRLILQYLVRHADDPIPLTPGVLRSAVPKKDGRELGAYGSQLNASTHIKSVSKRPREDDDSSGRRVSLRQAADDFTRPRDNDPLVFREPWPPNAPQGGNV